eukprot:Phypoly_transcript_07124.p1 GENE.Phypoly_transcript_07124~~Phypoly_transcript_07124.p1  ORF type:complete len:533 (+),score=111.78 Phypoly_transcript_07124:62-1660(+)
MGEPTPPTAEQEAVALSPEEIKARRYRQAAEYNALLLHQKQERGPFYYEPHTRTVQVGNSWIVRYNSTWARPRAPIVRLHEQQQLVLQKQMQQQLMQQQQQRQADHMQQQQQLLLQQQLLQQQIYHNQLQHLQLQQQQNKDQAQQEIVVYDENGDVVPKPKPAITAFIHYSMLMRDPLKKQHPGMNITDLSKVMGVKWRAMDEEERKPYMDKARDDKRRFDKELEEYQKKLKLSQQNPSWANRKAELADDQNRTSIPSPLAPPSPMSPSGQQQNKRGAEMKRDLSKIPANPKCETCGGKQINPGQLVTCATCLKSYHPTCLSIIPEAQDKIKKLPVWKCIDCKMCEVCNDPGNEDKLMICDACDAGYHTFCISPPLNRPPQGGWRCQDCVQCVHCGAKTPGTGASCKWRANYTACDSCYQLYMDNKYCPVCERVYRFTDKSPMVECEGCNRWVHIQCDGIDDEAYKQMAQDDVHYLCPVCRKEKPDPSDRHMSEREIAITNSKTNRKVSGEHTKGEKRKRRKMDDEFVDIED